MKSPTTHERRSAETRGRLVDAAQALMLRQGFAGTSVDEICAGAGVTKGAFFHHFPNKEAVCRAALDAWGEMGTRLYAAAWADAAEDPLAQLDRMFDIMISFTTEREEPCLCMVGMMSQEVSLTNPELRAVCAGHLETWTRQVQAMLERAKRMHPPAVDVDPQRVAWLLNGIWQGSMLIAKTRQVPATIVSNLELARAYVHGLFSLPTKPVKRARPAKPRKSP